jgi:hypothetical protein
MQTEGQTVRQNEAKVSFRDSVNGHNDPPHSFSATGLKHN